ncbi:MAG TPA: hypothetical protein VM598_12110, partial [Bdellovibrionota bacterium]|nr:hypothetical protein [Bdellovibrionota bacterium]
YPFYASSWPILNLASARGELERTAQLIGNQRRIAIVVAPSATRRPVFHFKLADYCESAPAKFRNLTYPALGCDRITDDDVMYGYTQFCRQERQDLYEDVMLGVISCPGARAIYLEKGCPSDGDAGWACPR